MAKGTGIAPSIPRARDDRDPALLKDRFHHDLGDDDVNGTGYTVVCWIEEAVATRAFVPPRMHIHSANIVGRQRMARGIEVIERLASQGPRP